jgi:adenylosuccinate synthase
MSAIVIVGAQWGDEGKGKIVDLYTETADVVVRYAGGPNAGHTLVVGEERIIVRLIPSGILRPRARCVMAQGMVIDPAVLLGEIDALAVRGHDTTGRLFVSDRAHLILPYHPEIDALREHAAGAGEKIGTTKRGIGPCYEDKAARRGIRVGDLKDLSRVEAAVERALRAWGAQGTLLDLDHGTYPFVTSSSAVAGGAAVGSGLGPTRIRRVVGITKGYATRVGEGPFPTELLDATGDRIRTAGSEFGSVTGRPRRTGWIDLPALRYAARVNGLDGLAITKLDVMTGLPELRACVAYETPTGRTADFPIDELASATPVYETLPGWTEDLSGARALGDLPDATLRYVKFLEEQVGVPVDLLSVGPRRNETIILRDAFA